MAKNSIADWSTTASFNTDIAGINIDEGCPAANVNNAIREMMAQVKTSLGFIPVEQGGGSGMTNNKVRVGWDGTGKLLAQVDANPIGAIWTDSLTSQTFDTAGYIKLPNGFILQWFSASVNSDAVLNYPIVFPTVVYVTMGSIINSGSASNVAYTIRTQGLTTSTFQARIRSITGGGVGPAAADASFIAIGR